MKNGYFLVIFGIFLVLQPVFLSGQSFPGMQGDPFSAMDRAFSAVEDTPTLEDEYYLGRAVAANILAAYRPYTQNPALTQYLNRICQALVINSTKPVVFNGYHVMIINSPGYNAFATPGGHIFLTKGLVDAAPSEDALAGIIAHELAHIILRHSASIIDDMRITEDAASMAQQAAAFAGRGNAGAQRALAFRNSVAGVLDTMMKNGFSRPQEFEADRTAVELLAKTGYDPGGLLDMLTILQRVQRSQSGGFNSTHPTPDERIANIRPVISRYRVADTRSYRVQRFKNK